MGFLTGLLTAATKFLPSIGTGILEGIKAGVQDAASRMGDSLLSSSTSDMSGAVSTYRKQYSFWSSQKPMGPYARFDKRLFEMTKVGGKYGVNPNTKPMGFLSNLIPKNIKADAVGLPIIPLRMSRGQTSLFSSEYRMTNC